MKKKYSVNILKFIVILLFSSTLTTSSYANGVDETAPTVTFSPLTAATDVAVANNITITFNEAIVLALDASEITDTSVDELITLKLTDAEGEDVGFNATINAGKTVITINPTANLTNNQAYYVAIGATVEDAAGNNIAASNATFTTVAADETAPTVTFSPLTAATDVAVANNITITFNEAIVLALDASEITDTSVDELITLKLTDAEGEDVGFNATINAGKTVITINPTANLTNNQAYYVAIGATVEDAAGNNIAASNATFTTVAADETAPTVTFSPLTAATDVAVANNITITFNEAIVLALDASEITDTSVDELITLKLTDAEGEDVGFNATINAGKTVITINPTANLTNNQAYYVAIGATVEDAAGNNIAASNATFTTVAADETAPTVTFSPLTAATDVAVANNITITFNEAIVLALDASEITDTSVDELITLKLTDAEGEDVGFNATINAGKTVITINPTANLTNNQAYYVAIGATVEDAAGNNIAASNATFTTVAAAPSGGGGSPAPAAPSAPALKNQSAITLTSSVTTIEFGGSFTVSAKGGESTGGITYVSSGNALCAIDASGNVTAVGKGTCTITATRAGDATYSSATSNSVTVTVTDNVVPGGLPTTEPSFVPTMSVAKPVNGVTTARIKIDTFYAGDRVSVLLGKKVGSKTTYRTLGSATVSATGQVTYKSKVALSKGSILRLKIGSEVIFSRTIN